MTKDKHKPWRKVFMQNSQVEGPVLKSGDRAMPLERQTLRSLFNDE